MKIKVGVLGATGNVGQRFIQLLENHPIFELSEIAASAKSADQKYQDAVKGRWKISSDIPKNARNMTVKECKPNLDCKIVFSGLDAEVAGDIEEDFAKAGYFVFSNAKNHRMTKDVPLLIPEVNANHSDMIKVQQKNRGWKGFIVTNPNCTTIGLVMALAPLQQKFGISKVIMTSMQAISGAGYPGVASMDILDNVVPYIGQEEEKVEIETKKLLGEFKENKFNDAKIAVSASCNRVMVSDGHTETVSISLHKKVSEKDIIDCWNNYNPLGKLNLNSAPKRPIAYRYEHDRPQPRLDRMEGNGMSAVVGRLRKCQVLDWKFTVLSHNTIRGAAGCSILNAEYLVNKNLI